ncbi:MAG TPA: hypothetical protein VL793_10720, partial [Patescibacteria group bacterium]|nr:hypothetical protein [Patescibacteria group bacterium]
MIFPWKGAWHRAGASLALLLTLIGRVCGQDFSYANNSGSITITGYNGPGGAVTIPSTIAGLPVTALADRVFLNVVSLTSVSLPETLRSLGEY